jgi:hypothetical protein
MLNGKDADAPQDVAGLSALAKIQTPETSQSLCTIRQALDDQVGLGVKAKLVEVPHGTTQSPSRRG